MLKIRIIIITSVFSIGCLSVIGQSQFAFHLNARNDSLAGSFYLKVGYVVNGKFYKRDIRDATSNGFYYSKKGNNIFNGDTLYTLVQSKNVDFITILDSLELDYHKYSSSFFVYDSLIKTYFKRKRVRIKNARHKNKEVFIKLNMMIFYNHSYIKQEKVTDKYCFNKKGKLIFCLEQDLFFKPILKFRILSIQHLEVN